MDMMENQMNSLDLGDGTDIKRRRVSTGCIQTPNINLIKPCGELGNLELKVNESNNEKSSSRRSLRKRINPLPIEQVKKKLRKRFNNDEKSLVEKLYLDQSIKTLTTTLETIFEEPQSIQNKYTCMSNRKFRRFIDFNENLKAIRTMKIKKRKMKASKLSKMRLNRKGSLDLLHLKLRELDQSIEQLAQ